MFTDRQRVERHEVEHWVREAWPRHEHFTASVVEVEEPEKGRVRVTITILGPNGEQLISIGRVPRYSALKSLAGMAQTETEWVA